MRLGLTALPGPRQPVAAWNNGYACASSCCFIASGTRAFPAPI